MNYFLLFNLVPRYDIDLNFLNKQYLDLQKKIHNNNFVTQTGKVSEINLAYKVLKDPYKRAEHLLAINGFDIYFIDLKKELDQNELKKILNLFELANNCKDRESLFKLLKRVKKDQEILIKILSNKFAFQLFSESIYFTIKLKYICKLLDHIKQRIEYVS
ncbi:MAG: Fe-S protein assembly co-chaperone HscB [Rickettsia sp.]|nr:Fe-S protein assembly co-chaperone HscB [Rickettsia sp.]